MKPKIKQSKRKTNLQRQGATVGKGAGETLQVSLYMIMMMIIDIRRIMKMMMMLVMVVMVMMMTMMMMMMMMVMMVMMMMVMVIFYCLHGSLSHHHSGQTHSQVTARA